MPARAILVAFILSASAPVFADCKEPAIGTKNIPSLSPPLGEVVIGSGTPSVLLRAKSQLHHARRFRDPER